ncbi:MAG TPA: hypothetical protein VGQ85_08145 [Candidatus Limnocylindrales bacterium]|nr:hypothetical protein [Candidatus Limnocylindrales bacterium]
MRPGSIGWWAGKVRQTRRHLTARVSPRERQDLAAWLRPAELAIFDGMHIADRRHGLDVVATLRVDGVTDPEVLVAGLLHDAGKGDTSINPRVIYSLSAAYGDWISRAVSWLPGMTASLARLRAHAETSAQMAAAAGCSERTVELIRWQDAPRDPEVGERLRLADEAN